MVGRSYTHFRQSISDTIQENIENKSYQRRYQIAMVIAHHADLLGLLEHIVDLVVVAVQHNMRFARVLDLLEKWPV